MKQADNVNDISIQEIFSKQIDKNQPKVFYIREHKTIINPDGCPEVNLELTKIDSDKLAELDQNYTFLRWGATESFLPILKLNSDVEKE